MVYDRPHGSGSRRYILEEGNDESEPSGSLNPRLEVGIVDENASYFKYRLEGTSTYHESARADEDGYAYANVSIPADSMTGRTEYQVLCDRLLIKAGE